MTRQAPPQSPPPAPRPTHRHHRALRRPSAHLPHRCPTRPRSAATTPPNSSRRRLRVPSMPQPRPNPLRPATCPGRVRECPEPRPPAPAGCPIGAQPDLAAPQPRHQTPPDDASTHPRCLSHVPTPFVPSPARGGVSTITPARGHSVPAPTRYRCARSLRRAPPQTVPPGGTASACAPSSRFSTPVWPGGPHRLFRRHGCGPEDFRRVTLPGRGVALVQQSWVMG